MLAEDRAHRADDAWLVRIAGDDHRALEMCFDHDTVKQHEARCRVLEHGAFDPPLALTATKPQGDEAG